MNHPQNTSDTGRDRVIKNIIYLLSGTAVSQGLTSLTLLLTARVLGPQNYGQYTSTLTLAFFTSVFFNLGLNTWGLHEASRNPQQTRWVLGSMLSIKLVFGLAWCVLMFVLASIIDSQNFPKDLLRMNVLVVWVDSLLSSLLIPLKVFLKNHLTSTIMIASDVLWIGTTLAIIYLGVKEPLIYIEYRLYVLLLSVLLIAPWIIRFYQLRPRLEIMLAALRASFPYASAEFLLIMMNRIDVLLVAMMLDRLAVGIYAPAVGIVNALTLLLDSVSGVMIPVLSKTFSQDFNQGWREAKRFILFLAVFGLALTAALWVGMGVIGWLLGASYAASLDILKILSFILVIHSFAIASASILTSTNQQSKRSAIQAATVTLNIILNVAAILLFGIIGAAVVFVVTELFQAIAFSSGVLEFHRSQVRSKMAT